MTTDNTETTSQITWPIVLTIPDPEMMATIETGLDSIVRDLTLALLTGKVRPDIAFEAANLLGHVERTRALIETARQAATTEVAA